MDEDKAGLSTAWVKWDGTDQAEQITITRATVDCNQITYGAPPTAFTWLQPVGGGPAIALRGNGIHPVTPGTYIHRAGGAPLTGPPPFGQPDPVHVSYLGYR